MAPVQEFMYDHGGCQDPEAGQRGPEEAAGPGARGGRRGSEAGQQGPGQQELGRRPLHSPSGTTANSARANSKTNDMHSKTLTP